MRVTAPWEVAPAAVPGHSFRVVADGSDTDGAYSVTEATSPVGAGVPPHIHDSAVECFFVLDGEYRLTVSGTTHEAHAGDFALVPRGAPHGFEVVGGTYGRAVVMFAPAGFETAFRRMPEIFGTPGEPGPLWAEINARFDTRLLPPGADVPPGPAAVTLPHEPGRSIINLADTGTGLGVSLRSDLATGGVWAIEPAVAAAWIVEGRYRFETQHSSYTAGEGEFISFGQAGPARAVSLTRTGRVLFLRTGEQESTWRPQ